MAPVWVPVVWVQVASLAVGVMQSLLSEDLRAPFVAANEADYADVRARHANKGDAKPLMPLERARGKKFQGGWADYAPPAPLKPGLTVFDDYPLADLVEIIDWTPFFQTWELSGRYPAILEDPVVGAQATELFADARAMLDRIIGEKWLTARGVAGFWPCARDGDDVTLHAGTAAQPHQLALLDDKTQ